MYTPDIPGSALPNGMQPAAFEAVASQAILTAYDIYSPQELTTLFARHDLRPGFAMMLDNFGFSRPGSGPTVGHWEEDWKIDNITVGNIIGIPGGPGTDVVIELAPENMITNTVGATSVYSSYPVKNDIIKLPSGEKAMIVDKNISVNPHRLTLRPTRATVNLGTLIIDGATYFISDNAHAEGSGQPNGRMSRVLKYSNTYQIVKEDVSVTGTELTNEAVFEPVEGRRGSMYLKAKEDTLYRFELARDGALIFGQQIDNISVANSRLGFNVPIQGTQGLYDFAEKNGHIDEYNPLAFTIADFDEIGRTYTRERIGRKDIMGLHGYEHYLLVENTMMEFVKASQFNYAVDKYFGNVEDYGLTREGYAVKIGFNYIEKGGFSYIFKVADVFNDIKYAGTAGYDYPATAIYMPIGKTANKNPEGDRTLPTIGYKYKSLNGYSRKAEIWSTGGAGPIQKTNDIDIMDTHFRSEIAFHGACANQVIIQRPQ